MSNEHENDKSLGTRRRRIATTTQRWRKQHPSKRLRRPRNERKPSKAAKSDSPTITIWTFIKPTQSMKKNAKHPSRLPQRSFMLR